LSNLQYLNLSDNPLSGTIPESLGSLNNLKLLGLVGNQLSGPIPESLGNLNNLQSLYLYKNELSGSIPESLGNLNNLQFLYLYKNELSGSIPESLGNLSNLRYLDLHENEFSGSIPESLGNLSNLRYLYLYENEFSGSIPESLGNLSQLWYLDLHDNELSGSIPEWLGNLSNLRNLFLHQNELSGSIPESLGNLRTLDLMNNQLCGEIPASWANLSNFNLYFLKLQNNHLTASDPKLIEWLNAINHNWGTTQTPCPCFVYALHDGQLKNSQLFTIDPSKNFQVNALGNLYQGYDLEGLDVHPKTGILYASSGDNPAPGLPAGYLYQVNKTNGNLTPICHTGLGEVSAMAFHPQAGHLWVWADGEGLFTIDINQIEQDTCAKTEIIATETQVEGLTWDTQGQILYAAAGKALYQFDSQTGAVDKTCHHFPGEVEALSMLKTGELLFGLHQANDTDIHSFNLNNCTITNSHPINTPYNDIEGMVWVCPE